MKKYAKNVEPLKPTPGYLALEIEHPHEPGWKMLQVRHCFVCQTAWRACNDIPASTVDAAKVAHAWCHVRLCLLLSKVCSFRFTIWQWHCCSVFRYAHPPLLDPLLLSSITLQNGMAGAMVLHRVSPCCWPLWAGSHVSARATVYVRVFRLLLLPCRAPSCQLRLQQTWTTCGRGGPCC